ncbi:hypothetical protein HanPI659440_Chr12g0463671 [Helianthus annuus]|nr:hypothetical protein HanPI659440_Chr12g0463671 [Helianthus annuus]
MIFIYITYTYVCKAVRADGVEWCHQPRRTVSAQTPSPKHHRGRYRVLRCPNRGRQRVICLKT